MSSYTKAKQKYEAEKGSEEVAVRTNYHCAAHGCPNAAAINDGGEQRRGLCFHHFSASPESWHEVTRQIRANPAMRNHGNVPCEPSAAVKDMKSRLKPGFGGIRSMTTDREVL